MYFISSKEKVLVAKIYGSRYDQNRGIIVMLIVNLYTRLKINFLLEQNYSNQI
jgi:hypothetical protein